MLFLALFALNCLSATASEQRRPNVILILVDDMGYSDIGCYGGEIETPNLDALATGGVRFTQFYNTAKCYTTRASLLTGLYHQQALDGKVLNQKCVTVAEVLGNAGYVTGMSGKWHLSGWENADDPALMPPSRGFQHFFGTIIGAGSYFEPHSLLRGGKPFAAPDGFYYTDAITADAVAALAKYQDRGTPFFHYVAYTAPHWPMHIPSDDDAVAKYRKIYARGWDAIRQARFQRQRELGIIDSSTKLSPRDSRVDRWDVVADRDWQIHRMAVYAAMVERMDRGVGAIVQELKRQHALDHTLILFLSDNGGSPEDIGFQNGLNTLGGVQRTRTGRTIQIGSDPAVLPGGPETYQGVGRGWANVNDTPFKWFKTYSHEGGIATPLIAHWPDGTESVGGTIRQVGHVIDVMPTVLDVAGVAYPDTFEGRVITPFEGISLAESVQSGRVQDRTLFWEFGNHAAVRDGRWKLVTLSTRSRQWQLHDMNIDRSELVDLAEKMPEVTKKMATQFERWAMRVGYRDAKANKTDAGDSSSGAASIVKRKKAKKRSVDAKKQSVKKSAGGQNSGG